MKSVDLHKTLPFFHTHIPHIVEKFFNLYVLHDPKNNELRARGQWTKKIFSFSTLLDGLSPILTIFPLKMQKNRLILMSTSKTASK
jgi:hypothetical protein